MSGGSRSTTSKHVLTSSFNRFERPQPRDETNKWPFHKFPAASDERAANELSRRIKWPTDLNSLGIDSNEPFEPVRKMSVPFHFPESSSSLAAAAAATAAAVPQSTLSPSSHPTDPLHSQQTATSAIGDKNHNPNDTSNEMANIASNVYDIVTNTTNIVTHITNIAIATANVPAGGATASANAIPVGFVPEIYIDENGIFQIKYVQRAHVGKNNETVSIEMFATNTISPIANNSSEQRTNTTSSINAEIDEAAINSYDDQQFELDIRFGGRNERVENSSRDNMNGIATVTSSRNGAARSGNEQPTTLRV